MTTLRPDLQIIFDNIAPGARVLDIGCGDGALLSALRDSKSVEARGLEIAPANVAAAIARGLSVVQGDADMDLAEYPDQCFDYAVLSQTLQTTVRPDQILRQLVRIGKQAFVSFPNFAHWRIRAYLMMHGQMPVTRLIPEQWYDTPNIHHVTIDDFRALIADMGLSSCGQWFLSGDSLTTRAMANLLAEHAVFLLEA